jgi:hypothetical protein
MTDATDQALANLRVVMTRRRAEDLRREAVRLAAAYERLARRHRLDAEVVEGDVSAIVAAWSKVGDARP